MEGVDYKLLDLIRTGAKNKSKPQKCKIAVRVIKIFTANVEGDLMFQQDLYMAYRKAIDAFEALDVLFPLSPLLK